MAKGRNDMTTDIESLPKYTFKEEVMNSITHFCGFVFAVGTLLFFIIFQILNNLSFGYMVPFYVYSLIMMMVFFISSFYHSSKFGSKRRAVVRVIDHCDIYAFVAATYLPICVHAVANRSAALAIMIIEVSLALAGIVLNLIPSKSKAISIIPYIIYIIDGWLMIFFYPFNIGLEFNVFLFVLIGGFVYSFGAITYACGKKKKWFHSIFHIFVVLAAMIQFIGILFILL